MAEIELYSEIKEKCVHSFFLSVNKSDFQKDEWQKELPGFVFPPEILNYHPKRREEFILGRLLLKKCFRNHFNLNVNEIPIDTNRRPIPPHGYAISITHDSDEVMVVVSKHLQSVGLDLESIGRIKPEMEKQILSAKDNIEELMKETQLSRDEVLALIFSAKESFYKVLSLKVKKYFGFERARIVSINKEQGTLIIELNDDLQGEEVFLSKGFQLAGHFALGQRKLLTYFELSSF